MATPRPDRKNPSARSAPANRLPDALNRHRTLARVGLAVAFPLLLLGLLEVGLRAAGRHYPTTYFLKVERTGGYGANRKFGWRFFPRAIARKPIPQAFPAEKDARTCRIFVLGASAALGVPNSTYSFAQQLDVMLEARHPGIRFEVINTAVTAINSHVVLPIAEEVAGYDPDLMLVYLGNNEVIGPFGIGAARGGPAPSLGAIRFQIGLRKTALGQALQSLGQAVRGGGDSDREWGGLGQYTANMVGPDDPELDRVHENYRRNLADIARAGTAAGVPVVLSTVAVNVKDSPPFASADDSLLAEPARTGFRAALDQGAALQDEGRAAEALPALQRAAELYPDHAGARYRLGRALLAVGDPSRAVLHLLAALEHDRLRFRADRHRNAIVREVAGAMAASGVFLADTERDFRTHEPTGVGLPGAELFFEHVHLNFFGNHLAARSMLETVERALPDRIRAARRDDVPVPDVEACARALALTTWDQYNNWAQIRSMVVRYPFTAQIGHDESLAGLDARLQELRAGATPEQARALLSRYEQALRDRPDDLMLMLNYSKLLTQTGNEEAGGRVFLEVLATQPPAEDLEAADLRQLTGGG
jgi:tetratricopeptide (TPR) repeat protein